MELTNDFTVDTGIDRAWDVLNDVEAIAPCLPGARLTEVEGEEFRGTVKVKVGPITAQYKGAATFAEQDREAGRIVLRAEGRETRGQGNAAATITAELVERGPDQTQVLVRTDLTLSGKVAQFGRGVLVDVSGKLMDQFAENLSATVLSEAPPAVDEPAAAPTDAEVGDDDAPAGPTLRVIDSPEVAPVDLVDAAGAPLARRVAPAVLVVVVLLVLRWLLRRRS